MLHIPFKTTMLWTRGRACDVQQLLAPALCRARYHRRCVHCSQALEPLPDIILSQLVCTHATHLCMAPSRHSRTGAGRVFGAKAFGACAARQCRVCSRHNLSHRTPGCLPEGTQVVLAWPLHSATGGCNTPCAARTPGADSISIIATFAHRCRKTLCSQGRALASVQGFPTSS